MKSALTAILVFIIQYMLFATLLWEPDPGHWLQVIRLLWVLSPLLLYIIIEAHQSKDES